MLRFIKERLLSLSKKRIELSLMIFIPVFLSLFALGPSYIVQDIIFTKLGRVVITSDEMAGIKGYVNAALWLSTLTAIIIGLILAYSILLPIKRLLKSLAVSRQLSSVSDIAPDSILGRDFTMMVSSLNKYIDILENMSGGVITVNSSGIVTTVNPSAEVILGCKSDELIGREIEDIFANYINSSSLKKIIHDSLNKQNVCSSEEINVVTSDKRSITLGTTTSLLKAQDGSTTGVVVSFKDLTRLKEVHNQLQRADRLASLGGIAAGVAHEIRNPLGSIKGLAQLLSEELNNVGQGFSLAKDNSKWAKYIDTIISEVERLNIVVENLLNLAHHDNVSMKLCNINEILHNAVEMSKYYIGEKAIGVEEEYDKAMPKIIAEAERLYQAFLNILINAVQAIDKKGKIWVKTRLKDDSIFIDLSNSNSYIRTEDIEHVFDPFYTTKEKGTGLGLAITHQIITSNGGTISAVSDDKGTHFYINLPIHDRQDIPVLP